MDGLFNNIFNLKSIFFRWHWWCIINLAPLFYLTATKHQGLTQKKLRESKFYRQVVLYSKLVAKHA